MAGRAQSDLTIPSPPPSCRQLLGESPAPTGACPHPQQSRPAQAQLQHHLQQHNRSIKGPAVSQPISATITKICPIEDSCFEKYLDTASAAPSATSQEFPQLLARLDPSLARHDLENKQRHDL